MKTLVLLFISVFLTISLLGQAPSEVNYQGIARNITGNVLPNQKIKLRLTIHDGSASGAVVYRESRLVTTNYFGMFSLGIGSAGAMDTTGVIAEIRWDSGGAKFLQVEMDPEGGSSLVNMGTAQLLSVPYAFYAGSATPKGIAGGSLTGTYPNPLIADNVITASNIADSSITASKLAPGVIQGSTGLGVAGGDLTGSYPNPIITANAVNTNKIADGSVTAAKIASGVIPTTLPPNGPASGDLTGTYPSPLVATGAITTAKLADASVTTAKVVDGSITASKLAAGIIGGSTPTGPAGGDLSGTYPNPVRLMSVENVNRLTSRKSQMTMRMLRFMRSKRGWARRRGPAGSAAVASAFGFEQQFPARRAQVENFEDDHEDDAERRGRIRGHQAELHQSQRREDQRDDGADEAEVKARRRTDGPRFRAA